MPGIPKLEINLKLLTLQVFIIKPFSLSNEIKHSRSTGIARANSHLQQ